MDHIYALGISIIEVIQDRFEDYEGYFAIINRLANPPYPQEYLFPFVSIFDSVFSAQLMLCTAFGGWCNSIIKWWLLEHRPYWWVGETGYYCDCVAQRPFIRQTKQTCETGPGCPSGHTQSTAIVLVLATCWISHYMTDRKLEYITWWKYPWYTLCAFSLGSVMLARMYVGAHFPHQVLIGALLGLLLTPFLCIYCLSFVWQYGYHSSISVPCAIFWHFAVAVAVALIGIVTNLSMSCWYGFDAQSFENMAFKWCDNPENIHKSTTPMYALVYDTGHLLGWALFVTPSVSKYRHYTTARSLVIASFSTKCLNYIYLFLHHKLLQKVSVLNFYITLLILCAVRVPLILRIPPALAMLPYKQDCSPKKHEKFNKKRNKTK